LGRLAACFMDSLATLGMPGYGYGINYEYGLFKQEITDGYQREKPDNWLAQGTPWQIARPDEACLVPVYGRIEHGIDREGAYNPMWMDWKVLIGIPHDMPIAGYGGRTVNFLRLYSARSSRDFDMQIFNDGDYLKAVEQKIASETISKVLYPSDAVVAGRELRLVQEYFLVACAVRDIVRRFQQNHDSFREFSAKVAIQLNDTHPALTVAELMRILVDEKDLAWEEAWAITQASLGYTNHTLAPEALETWPVSLLDYVLPRHLQIIHEINRRFLQQVAVAYPGDVERQRRMSLIEESAPKQLRMAHLAIVGSHSINGVSTVNATCGDVRPTSPPPRLRSWRSSDGTRLRRTSMSRRSSTCRLRCHRCPQSLHSASRSSIAPTWSRPGCASSGRTLKPTMPRPRRFRISHLTSATRGSFRRRRLAFPT